MFAENLLESSPAARKRKRWPMATAFTVEMIVAAVVIIVPLLSTGVIPLSARPPARIDNIHLVQPPEPRPVCAGCANRPGPASAPQQTAVVLVNDNPNAIHFGPPVNTTNDPTEARPGPWNVSDNNLPTDLMGKGEGPVVKQATPTRVISTLTEAQLVNRVEPAYPKMALAAGIQGEVKLHAIIARDGRVISLNVISGHPLLVHAAMDAVSQWRYRPYYLNGQPVEVETFVTVHFRKENR